MMGPDFVIPIVAILMPLALVSTIIALKQRGRRREIEHLERLKALEMGRSLPTGQFWPALTAMAIGVVLPLMAMGFAFNSPPRSGGDMKPLFGSMIALAGVIGGSALAAQMFSHRPTVEGADPGMPKTAHDPDAFDVVGRRG